MKKSNVKNPASTFLAFATIAVVWRAVRKMIKKYHNKQELYY